jgi:hypothetical protein
MSSLESPDQSFLAESAERPLDSVHSQTPGTREPHRLKAFIKRSKEALLHVRDKVQDLPVVQSLEDTVAQKWMDANIAVRMAIEEAKELPNPLLSTVEGVIHQNELDLHIGLRMTYEELAGFSQRHFPKTSEALARAADKLHPEGGFMIASYRHDFDLDQPAVAGEAAGVVISGYSRKAGWYTEELGAAGVNISAPIHQVTVASSALRGHFLHGSRNLDGIDLAELNVSLAGIGIGVGRFNSPTGEFGLFAHGKFLAHSAGAGIELKGHSP